MLPAFPNHARIASYVNAECEDLPRNKRSKMQRKPNVLFEYDERDVAVKFLFQWFTYELQFGHELRKWDEKCENPPLKR